MAKGFITREAGAVLNKNNKTAVKAAMAILRSVLQAAGFVDDEVDTTDDPPTQDKPSKTDDKTKPEPKTTATTKEASNRRAIEAAGFSVADLATLLQNALNDTRAPTINGEYQQPYRIVDIFDDNFIYCVGWSGTEYYRVSYTVTDDGSVTLDQPTYVNRKVTYIAPAISELSASEAGALLVDEAYTRLVESAVGNDGSTLIKLIAPGLGTSGLYTADVLQRDGPLAFPKGTKMFWDHDTAQEESQRPEGTLTRFAATLSEDARYIAEHTAGPGLYARAHVFEAYRDDLNEIANYIGTSIRADGRAKLGDYNGAKVPIITALKTYNGVNNRVDFVTAPGAGGKIVSLFESVRSRTIAHDQPQTNAKDDEMTPEEIQAAIVAGIREAMAPITTQVARLQEAATINDASAQASRILQGPKYSILPPATRQRITQSVATNAVLTESGAIDMVKLQEAIETVARSEATYLSSATGRSMPIGLGESKTSDQTNSAEDAQTLEAELTSTFGRWGLNEAAARTAAQGRTVRG